MTNFLEKANLFNEFFTQQCNTIENESTLPNDLVFETTERISSFDISKDKITKIIRYLENNNLLNPHQSGFRPGDSYIHQLLAITHDICKSFDANPSFEVRSIFLDMSKAFGRVWHEGLPFKLKRLGLSGKYYGLTNSFLRNRRERVVLNGQSSKWFSIKAGVPQ